MATSIDIPLGEKLNILRQGEATLKAEFLWGSNYTFLVDLELEGKTVQAVYKPTRGERPLWDFPAASLARREVAAYLVSEALGWNIVPPTVYRKKAPIGPGSMQLHIDHDPEYHYFNFTEADRQRLRPVALFDLIVNNADRKGSHILRDSENSLWLIDHGVCFHTEDKLRTVIWDFVGELLPIALCPDLTRLLEQLDTANGEFSPLASDLSEYISQAEVKAVAHRVRGLIDEGSFPDPDPYRRPYPWPQI